MIQHNDEPIKSQAEANEVLEYLIKTTASTLKIDISEATKRVNLLRSSGLLDTIDPREPHGQMTIDNFLRQDSETLQGLANYEKVLTECLSNKELVRQYDRLYHCNLTKAIRKANAGLPPANFKRQIEGFERFLNEIIFKRLENDNKH